MHDNYSWFGGLHNVGLDVEMVDVFKNAAEVVQNCTDIQVIITPT